MKSKGVSLCIAGALALGLVACGGSGNGSKTGSTGGSTAKKHYNVTFVPNDTSNPYFRTMTCGLQAAAPGMNVTLTTSGPPVGDVTKQLVALDAVIAKHPDGILLDAEDAKAFDAPIAEAKSEGIKVFFLNAAPADPTIGSGFVSTDDKAGGVLAGQEMVRLVGKQGGSIMTLGYNLLPSLKNRQDGFTETIAATPSLKYVGNFFDPQGDAAKNTGLVSANLAKHPDMVGVYALFDAPGSNVVAAIRAAGKTGKVKIISFDSSPELVSDLKAGAVQGLVLQRPAEIGQVALKQLVGVLDGGPAQGTTKIAPVLMTPGNFASTQKYLYKTSC